MGNAKDKGRQHYDDALKAIIKRMEQGDLPWNRPWKFGANGLPHNPTTGNPYRGGFNFMLLMLAGFGDSRWMGFGQAKKKGWKVQRGEKSTTIYAPIMRWMEDKENPGTKRPVCTGFRLVRVFNGEQVEGLPPLGDFPEIDPEEGYEAAAALLKRNGPVVKVGGDSASYSPRLDVIRMPQAGAFDSVAQYWGTFLHELAHWSGNKARLGRDQGGYGKGTEEYSYEELVAEITSAWLCSYVGIERDDMTANHAAYLQSWLKNLKAHPDALARAANDAWRAFCHLTGHAEKE